MSLHQKLQTIGDKLALARHMTEREVMRPYLGEIAGDIEALRIASAARPLEGQRLLDHIVARAQSSAMGLRAPSEGKTYSLDAYESKGLDSIALVLVSAHYDKCAHHSACDLVSLMQAAMEEVAQIQAERLALVAQERDDLYKQVREHCLDIGVTPPPKPQA